MPAEGQLLATPLDALHRARGARMVPFAGHAMPVQYAAGILAEHAQARTAAALFDVSHMGQIVVTAPSHARAAEALEALMPQDIASLEPGQQRYALLLDERAGILDDLMVTRRAEDLLLIVNASNRSADLERLHAMLPADVRAEAQPQMALLALQGPQAATALARLAAGVQRLVFMTGGWFDLAGIRCHVTRSGYTGEDGYEISVPADQATALADALLAQPEVAPAGLGARDTLRLEAGLCLHGHDIDPSTTPLEAGLAWSIQKVRRPGGDRAGGFPGDEVLARQFAAGTQRKRIGLVGTERIPVREGAVLRTEDGREVGAVTSGGFAPTAQKAIAMGYVETAHAAPGTRLLADVRGKGVPMVITAMPFVPHRYHRG